MIAGAVALSSVPGARLYPQMAKGSGNGVKLRGTVLSTCRRVTLRFILTPRRIKQAPGTQQVTGAQGTMSLFVLWDVAVASERSI